MADIPSQSERIGSEVIAMVNRLGIGALQHHNHFNTKYLTINSFSPHASDSEGTGAYKRLRRELDQEKQSLIEQRGHLERQIGIL